MVDIGLRKCDFRALASILRNKGHSWAEVNDHIDNIKAELDHIKAAMKKKGKSPEEIKAKFTEKFYELCQKMER